MSKVEVVPYDPAWRTAFKAEARVVADAMGENLMAIHHIGSTSIPGIYAKPVIDILVEVSNINYVDNAGAAMELLGYEVMGEFGIEGRRYFRKDRSAGMRTHQIHTFQTGSPHIQRHLAFRDYLIAHPTDALAYSDLKRRLVRENGGDTELYMDGKDDFIRETDRKASAWLSRQRGG
ncbi:MAG TPA: GrpB family protein [Pyrinomonadaceae bacterium]|nr:GrpB family protein [Pyrinomonadaceae bacterium]